MAASDAAAVAATGPFFENEPFVVRPDESRRNAWGDHMRLATPTETWQAWEVLTESLLLVPSPPTPEAPRERRGHEPTPLAMGIFSSALVQDVNSFFRILNNASAGGFLQGGMADAKTAQDMLGETAWLRSKGDYSLGELLANKVELLLCRAWHAHEQKSSSKRVRQSARALAHPSNPYLEERQALAQFLFDDLSNSQVRLRCVVFAVAKVIRAVLQEKQMEAAATSEQGGFASCRRMLEVLLLTTRLHLFRQGKESLATAAGALPAPTVQVMHSLLDNLFTTALTDCSGADVQQGRLQALLRTELLERRTAWHQQRLLEEFDVVPMSRGKGQRAYTDGRVAISAVLASPSMKATSNKKKKKRRNKVSGAVTAAETPAAPGGPQQEDEESMLPCYADKQVKEEVDGGRHFSRAVSSPPCLMSSVQKAGPPIERELEKSLSKEEGGEKNEIAIDQVVQQRVSCSVTEMATQTVLCGRDGEAEEEAGEGVEDCGQQAEEEREEGEKEEVAVEVPKRVEEEIAEAEEAAVVVEEEEDLEEKEEDASSMTCDDQQGGWGVSLDNSSSSSFSSPRDANREALGASSKETLLKDLCLKLEAEVATLRGVLAAQRGALSQEAGGGGNKYPSYSDTPPHGFALPSYGFAPSDLHLRQLPPHQHPLFSRHVLHHMEIMSDDGRGDGGGDSARGWQGGVSQPRASPFPPTSSTATVYSAEGTKHSIATTAAALGTMGRQARLERGGTGSAFAVSLPRNPSGPLHLWGERHHLHHPQQQQPQHHQQQHHHQSRQAISASVSLGGDDFVVPLHPVCPPVPTLLSSSVHHHPEDPGLRLSSAGLDLIQHERGNAKHALAHACSGFTLRRPLLDVRSRLCDDLVAFVRGVSETTASRLPQQTVAVNRCRQVVQSLWPRAQVKAFGSFVSGLALPSSDVDLVICLPKVRRDAPAEAPGVLEGRNAIKETWQQELARRLRATAWVNPASIKIISHTAIPVIKMKIEPRHPPLSMPLAGGREGGDMAAASIPRLELRGNSADEGAVAGGVAPTEAAAGEGEVYLDVSIEGGQHNGLLANRVIAELLRENPALRPLVLVLKHFMKERGLMESYSGGLSSYGLVLMVARYLQEQSNAMDTGSLLLGFLDFYSNHFDPRTMGVSTNHRCYFSRGAQQQQHQQQHQHHPQHMPSLGPHRRVSLGGGGDLDMPEYYVQQQQQQQQQQARPVGAPFLENPYKFDPLYLEDPICPSNNIGRNCFRIFQIQRAWNDAWRALDPSSGEGAPRLNRMLSTQEGVEKGA